MVEPDAEGASLVVVLRAPVMLGGQRHRVVDVHFHHPQGGEGTVVGNLHVDRKRMRCLEWREIVAFEDDSILFVSLAQHHALFVEVHPEGIDDVTIPQNFYLEILQLAHRERSLDVEIGEKGCQKLRVVRQRLGQLLVHEAVEVSLLALDLTRVQRPDHGNGHFAHEEEFFQLECVALGEFGHGGVVLVPEVPLGAEARETILHAGDQGLDAARHAVGLRHGPKGEKESQNEQLHLLLFSFSLLSPLLLPPS